MNVDIKHTLVNLFFIFLLLGIGYVLGAIVDKPKEHEPEYITDTFFADTVYDTIIKKEPYPVKETITDTIEIPTIDKDTIYLPKVQKEYNDSLWNIWISGVEPLTLDSVRLFVPKEKEIITITEKVKVIDKKPHLFGGVGIHLFYGGIATDAIVSTQLGNKWILGANVGVYNNKITYGLNVQFKIF